jgi:uncharacterized protein (TIGR03086 family)
MPEPTDQPSTDQTSNAARTLQLIPAAIAAYGATVHAVAADRWDAPTPDTEWSVRVLVNHLVMEHSWAPLLLDGATIEEVGDRFDGDLVGTDPVGGWDTVAAASSTAWAAQDDPEKPVHLSFGTVPLREYAEQMLLDLVVHRWDLAAGAGLDRTMDPAARDAVLAGAEVRDFGGGSFFGAAHAVDSDDPQVRLLALTGRHADWSAPS